MIALLFLLASMGEVSGGSATTQFNVQATVTPWLEYSFLKQNDRVHLTKGNIKNGYKDADSNTVIKVTTNNPNGFVISLYCESDDFFTSVSVTTDTGSSYILTPGSTVDIYGPYEGLDPVVRQIDVRFFLSPNAQPIDYPWPIVITVNAL